MYATPAFGLVCTFKVTSAPGRMQVGDSLASTGTSDEGVQGSATGLGPVCVAPGAAPDVVLEREPDVEVLPVVPVVPGVDPFNELDALDALGEGDVEPLPRAPALEEPHAARARESSTSPSATARPRDRPSIDIFIRQIILGLPRPRLSRTAA